MTKTLIALQQAFSQPILLTIFGFNLMGEPVRETTPPTRP